MRPLVQVSPMVVSGSAKIEIALFTSWASAWQAANPHKILDLFLVPCRQTPATVARNKTVKRARDRHVDILFMIDDDMVVSPGFFEAALEFLVEHDGPAGIGVPYCTAPPLEDVTVFELTTKQTGSPEIGIKMDRIRREDAARCKGIERVVNMGTGCVAYDMRLFDRFRKFFKNDNKPFFEYGYNEDHTEVIETEDCWFHRHMAMAGLPLYCHWDFWAGHWKQKLVGKPGLVEQEHINEVYIKEAEANLRKPRIDKVPYRGQKLPADVLKGDIGEPKLPADPEERDRLVESFNPPVAMHMPRQAVPAGENGQP